jgi:FMN phosphatase YigB (HAD superfamily)
MNAPRRLALSDWAGIRLVAFDVDGTLYDQSRLRLHMLRDLLLDAAARRSAQTITVLRAYRHIRERLAKEETPDFEPLSIAETARVTKHSTGDVRAIVGEWIERRPLRHLASCRCPGIAELFAGLRRKGKIVGVLSDYPARDKLAALALKADHVVCAGDPGIGMLKPHPRGLAALIEAAGAEPQSTVLIGDRAERDGAAALRAGAWPLIRTRKSLAGWQTFARFDDPIFQYFLHRSEPSSSPRAKEPGQNRAAC